MSRPSARPASKKTPEVVAWEPKHEEALTKRWFLLVAVTTDRNRWRWAVTRRDTHKHFKGTKLARSFDSARGYSSSREKAKACAEVAMRQIEDEEAADGGKRSFWRQR